jgi:predicted ATPase
LIPRSRVSTNPRADHFPLKRLTVVCGTNSSGKSTLVKAPLLLQQAIELSPEMESPGLTPFAGPLVDMGTFRTVVSNQSADSVMEIGLELQDRMPTRTLALLRGSRSRSDSAPSRIRYSDYFLSANFVIADARLSLGFRTARGVTPRGLGVLQSASFVLSDSQQPLLNWTVERRQPADDIPPWPTDYVIRIPTRQLRRMSAKGSAIPSLGVVNKRDDTTTFGAELVGLLSYLIVGRRSKSPSDHSDSPVHVQLPLPPHIEIATNDLRLVLDAITYIGPLRAPARRYYSEASRYGAQRDSTGERMPYILRDQLRRSVTYVPPGSKGATRRALLKHACDQWLHYLRTGKAEESSGDEMAVSSLKNVLVEVHLRSSTTPRMHALVDSGFGYSQVLPILVSSLLAPPAATIVVEQPELHLNPALQVRLADFFVAVARNGRQVILETHSEHIVNALRVATAEETSGELSQMIGITYLDSDGAELRKLDMNVEPNGDIEVWPRAFFGEALDLTSRLLSAQRHYLSGSEN